MKTSNRRGGASLIIASILALVLVPMAGVLLVTSLAQSRKVDFDLGRLRALEIADAGIDLALYEVNESGMGEGSFDTGTIALADGQYRVTGILQDTVGTLESVGTYNRVSVRVTATIGRTKATLHESFMKAIYAGNWQEVQANGGVPKFGNEYTYDMVFGGGVDRFDSGEAYDGDYVYGDIYSGGKIHRDHQAILAKGEIVSMGNMELGKPQLSEITEDHRMIPPPNIPAMNYETNHDVNVSARFGGTVGTLPETDPAHILVKGDSPSGASLPDAAKNGKTNYWLVDPYEPVTSQKRKISLSADGNEKIYFIDGNLLLHDTKTLSFTFSTPGTRVTFVVKGNIFLSDDLEYADRTNDMVAFVAMRDPEVADSGNVYIGDTQFGTVDNFHGILFAENDFHDNNLTSAGAAHFHVLGGMLAAEKVLLSRDYFVSNNHWEYVPGKGNVYVQKGWYHSEMNVVFDDRLKDVKFKRPPGLPTDLAPRIEATPWTITSWSRSG